MAFEIINLLTYFNLAPNPNLRYLTLILLRNDRYETYGTKLTTTIRRKRCIKT